MREKYVDLARSILAESGSRSIRSLFMIAMMKEGYFIASADLRGEPRPVELARYGKLDTMGRSVIIHVDPTKEHMLPILIKSLRERYGKEGIKAESRYDLYVEKADIDEIRRILIYPPLEERLESVWTMMLLIMPEGFRITKRLSDPRKLTVLCSQWPLKETWIKQMNDLHKRTG